MSNTFGFTFIAAALTLTASATAQDVFSVSIGIRETEAGSATLPPFPGIGADGGTSGGIEWVNLDGQSLILDGTWQPFVFNIPTDPLTAFAGSTANGTLDGTWGTLEHVRIINTTGVDTPVQIWVDDITNTVTPAGGAPTTTTIADFEGFLPGAEVVFQESSFSGSTSGNVVGAAGPDMSGIDDTVAFTGVASDRLDFQFISNAMTNWVRFTTFRTTNSPNPAIRFDQNSQVMFWLRGVACPIASATPSAACTSGHHSNAGPLMSVTGLPTIGGTFDVTGDNLLGSPLCGLLVGPETPPLDLTLIGGLPGSKLCIQPFATLPCNNTSTTTITFALGTDPGLCGLTLALQWIDFDATGAANLPFGTSQAYSLTVGL